MPPRLKTEHRTNWQQYSERGLPMSVLGCPLYPPKADIRQRKTNVRNGSIAVVASAHSCDCAVCLAAASVTSACLREVASLTASPANSTPLACRKISQYTTTIDPMPAAIESIRPKISISLPIRELLPDTLRSVALCQNCHKRKAAHSEIAG